MLETICPKCGKRYQVGTDHKCLPKSSERVKLAHAEPQRSVAATRKDAELLAPKPKRGRPRIHPDRKAYRAQWQREKRAKQKEIAIAILEKQP